MSLELRSPKWSWRSLIRAGVRFQDGGDGGDGGDGSGDGSGGDAAAAAGFGTSSDGSGFGTATYGGSVSGQAANAGYGFGSVGDPSAAPAGTSTEGYGNYGSTSADSGFQGVSGSLGPSTYGSLSSVSPSSMGFYGSPGGSVSTTAPGGQFGASTSESGVTGSGGDGGGGYGGGGAAGNPNIVGNPNVRPWTGPGASANSPITLPNLISSIWSGFPGFGTAPNYANLSPAQKQAALDYGIFGAESAFGTNPQAMSMRPNFAGALGPMQVTRGTALQYGFPDFASSPAANIRAGDAIANSLLAQFGDPAKAAAAYNSGVPNPHSHALNDPRNPLSTVENYTNSVLGYMGDFSHGVAQGQQADAALASALSGEGLGVLGPAAAYTGPNPASNAGPGGTSQSARGGGGR